MKQSPHKDVWAAGDLYEPYVGRWSRRVAREFLEWLAVPAGLHWLEVGCGTGALTQTILEHGSPKRVSAVDASPGYIEYAKAHVTAGPVSFEVGDAQSLPVETASVDAAVTGLMLNFVPKPLAAVAEMSRATRQGLRSSADRVPRRVMRFRSAKRAGKHSKIGFDPDCPLRKAARSS